MCDNHKPKVKSNRRNLLKSASAFAGLNLIDIQPSSEPRGEFQLIEAGFEYELESSEISESELPIYHFDFPPHYHIDDDRGALLTNPHADIPNGFLSRSIVRGFVVRGTEYRTQDAKLFTETTDELAYWMEPDFRRTYRLQLQRPVEEPQLSVHRDGNDAMLTTEEEEIRVTPNKEVRKKFNPIEMEVELTKVLDEKVQNPSIPDHRRPLKKEKRTSTVLVTPELRVRNNGVLSIYEGKIK